MLEVSKTAEWFRRNFLSVACLANVLSGSDSMANFQNATSEHFGIFSDQQQIFLVNNLRQTTQSAPERKQQILAWNVGRNFYLCTINTDGGPNLKELEDISVWSTVGTESLVYLRLQERRFNNVCRSFTRFRYNEVVSFK